MGNVFSSKQLQMLKITILAILLPFIALGQNTMNIGFLKLVKPTAELSRNDRCLRMKMTSTPDYDFYTKVGGVAFTQIAQPEFDIQSFHLDCDINDNSAYAVINGMRYSIPLETWQLMPIVEYADDEYNSIVTIFGDENAIIKYHEAFLDELLGLRMLQTDLILTDIIGAFNIGVLPSQSIEDDYILSPAEKEKMSTIGNDNYMMNAYYKYFDTLIQDLLKQYSTAQISEQSTSFTNSYVFTDINSNIKFNITDDNIRITGYPYYSFVEIDYDNRTVTEDKEKTEEIRSRMNDDIYPLNPIVFDAAYNVCQWSAFFRYAKLKNPQNWNTFREQVSNLISDAPDVWTPIEFQMDFNLPIFTDNGF